MGASGFGSNVFMFFFFKQKTAYEMQRSLVGSEMCIRDSSFDPEAWVSSEPMSCHITRTTAATHQLIKDNLHLTPIYGGFIDSKGPRYCPSIEDKIVRFADKDSHQIFLEPEGRDTPELYIQGFSTGLPERLQLELLRTLPAGAVRDVATRLQRRIRLPARHPTAAFAANQTSGWAVQRRAAQWHHRL